MDDRKVRPGDLASPIALKTIDDREFDSTDLSGKPYMISFFRFATCPFCNLRVNQLVSRFSEFDQNFTIVAIFDSPLGHLQYHAKGHKVPFPIMADETKSFYKIYGIEKSIGGMLKGMITRFPTMMKGILKGHIPFPIKGNLFTMPADFLVDRDGLIHTAYYGIDEGDHLPIEQIKEFLGNL